SGYPLSLDPQMDHDRLDGGHLVGFLVGRSTYAPSSSIARRRLWRAGRPSQTPQRRRRNERLRRKFSCWIICRFQLSSVQQRRTGALGREAPTGSDEPSRTASAAVPGEYGRRFACTASNKGVESQTVGS